MSNWEKFLGCWATFINKTLCSDLEGQKTRYQKEFKELLQDPENRKSRFNEFQIERMIENSFSVEKNNRLLLILTAVLTALTIVLTILTIHMAFKS